MTCTHLLLLTTLTSTMLCAGTKVESDGFEPSASLVKAVLLGGAENMQVGTHLEGSSGASQSGLYLLDGWQEVHLPAPITRCLGALGRPDMMCKTLASHHTIPSPSIQGISYDDGAFLGKTPNRYEGYGRVNLQRSLPLAGNDPWRMEVRPPACMHPQLC